MASRTDLSDCADCLCLASRRAARTITRAYDRRLRPFGIRTTQFTVLVMLILRGPLSIGELAEGLGTERTTLTRNLALLEADGWIALRPGDDARARIAAVTAKGRRLVEQAFPAWRKAQQATAAVIGNAGVNALRSLAGRAIR